MENDSLKRMALALRTGGSMSDDLESQYAKVERNLPASPKPPRITRTRWQLVRWHLRCAILHALGRLQ